MPNIPARDESGAGHRYRQRLERDAPSALAKDLFANRPMFVEIIDAFPHCKTIVPRLRDPAVARGEASIETRLQEIAEQESTYPQASEELAAVRRYLQRAIYQCESSWRENTRGITNHLHLLREIQRLCRPTPDDPVCLVTFNYDTLLEDALAHPNIGLQVNQMDDYTRRPVPFRLFKLHGSVNWGHVLESRFPSTELQPSNQFALCDPFTMRSPDIGHTLFPAIAIPVENKSIFECPSYMIEELKSTLPHVTKILVIGWRATEAHFLDLPNTYRLRGQLPSVFIVSENQDQARQTGARINPALHYSTRFSPESARGFTEFMRSGRPQEILGA